jgi:hypothetical protein
MIYASLGDLMNLEGFQRTPCSYRPEEVALGDYVKAYEILLSD